MCTFGMHPLEIAVKSEKSQFDAKFDGTPMIKEWEDLKRYVTSTSVEDTSGKVVSECGAAWEHGKLHTMI